VIGKTAFNGVQSFSTAAATGAVNSITYTHGNGFGFDLDGYTEGLWGKNALASYAGGMAGTFVSGMLDAGGLGKEVLGRGELAGKVVGYENVWGFMPGQIGQMQAFNQFAGSMANAGVQWMMSGSTTLNILNTRDFGAGFSHGLLEMRLGGEKGLGFAIGGGGLDMSAGAIGGALAGLDMYRMNHDIMSLAANGVGGNASAAEKAAALRALYSAGDQAGQMTFARIMNGTDSLTIGNDIFANPGVRGYTMADRSGGRNIFASSGGNDMFSWLSTGVTLQHEAYRNGIVDGNNVAETIDAVRGHTAMALRLKEVYGSSFISDDTQLAKDVGAYLYSQYRGVSFDDYVAGNYNINEGWDIKVTPTPNPAEGRAPPPHTVCGLGYRDEPDTLWFLEKGQVGYVESDESDNEGEAGPTILPEGWTNAELSNGNPYESLPPIIKEFFETQEMNKKIGESIIDPFWLLLTRQNIGIGGNLYLEGEARTMRIGAFGDLATMGIGGIGKATFMGGAEVGKELLEVEIVVNKASAAGEESLNRTMVIIKKAVAPGNTVIDPNAFREFMMNNAGDPLTEALVNSGYRFQPQLKTVTGNQKLLEYLKSAKDGTYTLFHGADRDWQSLLKGVITSNENHWNFYSSAEYLTSLHYSRPSSWGSAIAEEVGMVVSFPEEKKLIQLLANDDIIFSTSRFIPDHEDFMYISTEFKFINQKGMNVFAEGISKKWSIELTEHIEFWSESKLYFGPHYYTYPKDW
jgi:hypothetical protein